MLHCIEILPGVWLHDLYYTRQNAIELCSVHKHQTIETRCFHFSCAETSSLTELPPHVPKSLNHQYILTSQSNGYHMHKPSVPVTRPYSLLKRNNMNRKTWCNNFHWLGPRLREVFGLCLFLKRDWYGRPNLCWILLEETIYSSH